MPPETATGGNPVRFVMPDGRTYETATNGTYPAVITATGTGTIPVENSVPITYIDEEARAATDRLWQEVTAIKDLLFDTIRSNAWFRRTLFPILTEELEKAIEYAAEATGTDPEEISAAELLRILKQERS